MRITLEMIEAARQAEFQYYAQRQILAVRSTPDTYAGRGPEDVELLVGPGCRCELARPVLRSRQIRSPPQLVLDTTEKRAWCSAH
jgi:hypothetical protein